MKQIQRILEHPVRHFTENFSKYTCIFHEIIDAISPFFWEDDCLFLYIQSGSGQILVNQVSYPVRAGFLGILHSYHVFRLEGQPGDPLEVQALVHPYPEMVLMDFLPDKPVLKDEPTYSAGAFVPLSTEQQETVVSLLNTFQEELDCPDTITPLIRNCLFSQLRRIYINAQLGIVLPPPPLCGQLLYYIAAHSFGNLTAVSVAEKFGLSPSGVNRELRRVCGENFQGVLNHARLSNAYSMMLRSNISLSALAKQAGFSGEASFYRVFQAIYHTTPQQYRETLIRYLGGDSRSTDERLLEIESYVLTNFRAEINLESCAKDLFLTVESINQTLQKKYGPQVNFRQFLTSMRLRYAEGLLTMSTLPICDVALDAGFNSVHTFIRLFKQHFGMTPTQYRSHEGGLVP